MSPTIRVSSPAKGKNKTEPARVRPTAPSDVPKIFLTTTRDKICLLPDECPPSRTPERRSILGATACVSCSLPDLNCDADIVFTRPRVRSGGDLRDTDPDVDFWTKPKTAESPHRKHSVGSGDNTGTKLSVYCSPRVSRRGLSLPTSSHSNRLPGEYSWLHNSEIAKYIRSEVNRRESSSSVESDGSLRSASHLSTCATSEYSRFMSCDRLSLPVHDLSPNHPNPPGRLRRIYSNPEAPFLKESAPSDNQMRDSKSCSDLEKSLVDHKTLESKLPNEGGHLLSPPPLLPSAMLQGFVDSQWPSVGSPPPLDGWQETVTGATRSREQTKDAAANRDTMIRQWLQGVDPAIVVSQDFSQGTVANS